MQAGDKFDKRLIERRLRKGELSQEEVQAHMGALPDLSRQTAVVEARLEVTSDDDDDDYDDEDDDDDDE